MKKLGSLASGAMLFATAAYAHPVEMCTEGIESNGFFTLGNIGIFVGAIIIGIAALALYVLLELPIQLLKWVLLLVGVWSVYAGFGEPLGWPAGFWAFFGALGIGGFLLWFFTDLESTSGGLRWRAAAFFSAIIWGGIAITYDVSVVGFMAVAAFGYVIAASKMVDMLASPFGIGEAQYTGSTTLAGFIILMLYMLGVHYALPVHVFEFGALYVAGLVFSVSIVVATWSGLSKTWLGYVWHEAVVLTVALTSIMYGSAIGVEGLVQLGGTLIAAWVLLKALEVVFRIFVTAPVLAIVMLLVMGVGAVAGSTALMRHADWLQVYTFL